METKNILVFFILIHFYFITFHTVSVHQWIHIYEWKTHLDKEYQLFVQIFGNHFWCNTDIPCVANVFFFCWPFLKKVWCLSAWFRLTQTESSPACMIRCMIRLRCECLLKALANASFHSWVLALTTSWSFVCQDKRFLNRTGDTQADVWGEVSFNPGLRSLFSVSHKPQNRCNGNT